MDQLTFISTDMMFLWVSKNRVLRHTFSFQSLRITLTWCGGQNSQLSSMKLGNKKLEQLFCMKIFSKLICNISMYSVLPIKWNPIKIKIFSFSYHITSIMTKGTENTCNQFQPLVWLIEAFWSKFHCPEWMNLLTRTVRNYKMQMIVKTRFESLHWELHSEGSTGSL